MKKCLCAVCCFLLVFLNLFFINCSAVYAADPDSGPDVSAQSAVLMDADTGTVLYAKDPDTRRPLASVTKIMTLLLIFEAIDQGTLSLDDMITVSEHAAGMGGSQVFLEPGETQTAETMIKCITIASANDASVAMAEQIAGTEDAFVERMNDRAEELGMTETHFVNACGLDAEDHYSSAMDIARMSRALTVNHPEIFNYTGIWMEDMTHHTAKGETTFTLSSTNKLLRQYEYATGLKTGSTSGAGFCLSATATKDDVNLICVVMACDNSKTRIADSIQLLNWGFEHCRIWSDENTDPLPDVPVTGGKEAFLPVTYENEFRFLDTDGRTGTLDKTIDLPESVKAPVRSGDAIGRAVYSLNDEILGEVRILAAKSILELQFPDVLMQMIRRCFLQDS